MAALKASEIAGFLARPDPRFSVILVYGRDAGGVTERTDALSARLTAGSDDPFSLLRLDGDDIAAQPMRLADEANTIGLFGGKRVIRVRLGAKPLHKGLEPLIEAPPLDAVVIVEAGDLAKSSPVRVLVERAKVALAIPCYLDDRQEIVRLIDREMAAAGLRIDAEARALLAASLGGDRLATRSEIAKVATYAIGDATVSVDHVAAVVADVADTALDDLIDSAFGGERQKVLALSARLFADGHRPDALLASALRHALLLAQLTAKVADGGSAEAATRDAIRYFRREPIVRRQMEKWTSAAALSAAAAIGRASASARRRASLAETITQRCLLGLGQFAAGGRSVE